MLRELDMRELPSSRLGRNVVGGQSDTLGCETLNHQADIKCLLSRQPEGEGGYFRVQLTTVRTRIGRERTPPSRVDEGIIRTEVLETKGWQR